MNLRQFFAARNAPRQVDFAKLIGCAPSYLGRLVSGERRAGMKYIGRILKHTGGRVTAKDLNPDLAKQFKSLLRV